MRASMLTAVGRFETVEVERPTPRPGEVVVRVEAISICGSDLSAYLGRHPRIKPPAVLGHEFSGVIEEAGAGVEARRVGERVAVEPVIGCGNCRACRQGRENICSSYRVIGETADLPGAFAGRVRVAADHAHPLPDGVSFEEGAVVQPLAIGLHAVRDRAVVRPGEVALVVGAGPIGMAAALESQRAGARTIITDVLPYRVRHAARMGIHVAVVREDAPDAVRRETDGYGADVVFEAAGGASDDPFQLAVASAASGGRVIALGSFAAPALPLAVNDVKYNEIDIRGSQAHPNSFPDVIGEIAAGELCASGLITHRLLLSDVERAFDLLARHDEEVMKIVLRPDPRATV